jgi:hypothetical protein
VLMARVRDRIISRAMIGTLGFYSV